MNDNQFQDSAQVLSKPAIHLLKGKAFYPALFLLQLLILVIGESIGITYKITIIYIILPLGVAFLLEMKVSDLDKMSITSDPITKAISHRQGKKYIDSNQRSFIVQGAYYFIGFWATLCVMLVLVYYQAIPVGQVMVQNAWGLIVMNVLLVAPSETLVFHAMLPHKLDKYLKHYKHGIYMVFGISQLMFAVFHAQAFQWDVQLMFSSFIFGCIFLFIARRYGIATCMGVHCAYNLCVMGVFTGGLIGV